MLKWPGERDSNPWRCDPQRFSRPPLSTTQPSPERIKISSVNIALEATSGFEPEIKALQAHALPLGYVTLSYQKVVPEAGLEPARKKNSEGF